jgi:hypothetical protein
VVLVRGRNFGRQPTLSIAGQSATVVSRTEDGGILARVPPGSPAGQQLVVVSTEEGRSERPLTIRRLGVARVADRLVWLDLRSSGPVSLGTTTLPDARAVAVSPEGRAAYAVDGAGVLHVFELPAAGLPSARGRVPLALPVRALLAPPGAQRLVVVGERDLIELDTASPLSPRAGLARPLPAWAQGKAPLLAALSPDGRRLALGTGERNRLLVMELAELRGKDFKPAQIDLVPSVLGPVLADVTFAPDGRTVWVASGMTPAGAALGPQPTLVHAVRVGEPAKPGQPLTLVRARMVEVAGATRPQAIVTGRARPLASGAAIRLPPERATVHVAAYAADDRPGIFSIGADDVARPALIDEPAGFISRPEVSPDEAWLLALCGDRAGAWRLLGVALGGGAATTSLALPAGQATPAGTRPSIEVKVQP